LKFAATVLVAGLVSGASLAFVFFHLRGTEQLALAGGLAAVYAASFDGLARLRRALAFFFGAGVFTAFLDFRDTLPSAVKHLIGRVQFVPSMWGGHGETPALLPELPGFAAPLAAGVALACAGMLAFAIGALLAGRIYCSVICPLGILQDLFFRAAVFFRERTGLRRRFRMPFRPERKWLRNGVLAGGILAIATGWGGVALAWLDPYSHFGRVFHGIFRPILQIANNGVVSLYSHLGIASVLPRTLVPWGGIGILLPPLLFLTLVAALSAFRGRLYCNTFCPVGTLLGWFSRAAVVRIAMDRSSCRRCGECVRVCKAQCIDLKKQTVDASRCVACFNCMDVCDDDGIRPSLFGRAAQRQKLQSRGRAAAACVAPLPAAPSGPDRPPAMPPARPVSAAAPAPERRAFLAGTAGLALLGLSGCLPANGAAAKDNPVVAPPGARSRQRFLDNCTACQLCVSACPSHVLAPALSEYGTLRGFMKPRMNYHESFCNIDCVRCGEVCPDGALDLLRPSDKPVTRIGIARVSIGRCIVRTKNEACGACAEHCPTAALQMVKPKGGTFTEPVVNEEQCVGCGACEFICPARPVRAVVVHGFPVHEKARELKQEAVKPRDPAEDFPF
jgi:ferredoxin